MAECLSDQENAENMMHRWHAKDGAPSVHLAKAFTKSSGWIVNRRSLLVPGVDFSKLVSRGPVVGCELAFFPASAFVAGFTGLAVALGVRFVFEAATGASLTSDIIPFKCSDLFGSRAWPE